jgi:hypothetical protein
VEGYIVLYRSSIIQTKHKTFVRSRNHFNFDEITEPAMEQESLEK